MTKVIDVSGYQSDSVAFFKQMKANGVTSAVVKITEGTGYLNPRAGAQVTNALKVFGSVSVYHFFHGNAAAEAKYFLYWVKRFGLDKSTVLAIDVEATDLPYYTTGSVNAFLNALKAAGYKNVITYGSGSWFNSGRINRSALVDKRIWVAAYGTDRPGVNDANAWQYTDNFHGVDASLDFDGSLTGKGNNTPDKPEYYRSAGLYEAELDKLPLYKNKKFTKAVKRRAYFSKSSRFYAKPVKYGKITRLKTAMGYVSSNKEYVRLVEKAAK